MNGHCPELIWINNHCEIFINNGGGELGCFEMGHNSGRYA